MTPMPCRVSCRVRPTSVGFNFKEQKRCVSCTGGKPESVIRIQVASWCYVNQRNIGKVNRLSLPMSHDLEPLPSQPVILLSYSKCQHVRVSLSKINFPSTYFLCDNVLLSVLECRNLEVSVDHTLCFTGHIM